MSQSEKSAYFQALKEAGTQFKQHYRNYTVEELKAAYAQLEEAGMVGPFHAETPPADNGITLPPLKPRDPDEMAGVRQNTLTEDEPLRTDPETGLIWYQEEVPKVGYAKPRGRRVLKYEDSGSRTETVKVGEFTESFEVAGNESRISEAKITLPSFQVGIYKDPRHPFKTHVYNGAVGFDLFEVEEFYGGADRVPEDVKRIYVSNVLCYDIRTVVRDIETEYRRLALAGKVPS